MLRILVVFNINQNNKEIQRLSEDLAKRNRNTEKLSYFDNDHFREEENMYDIDNDENNDLIDRKISKTFSNELKKGLKDSNSCLLNNENKKSKFIVPPHSADLVNNLNHNSNSKVKEIEKYSFKNEGKIREINDERIGGKIEDFKDGSKNNNNDNNECNLNEDAKRNPTLVKRQRSICPNNIVIKSGKRISIINTNVLKSLAKNLNSQATKKYQF